MEEAVARSFNNGNGRLFCKRAQNYTNISNESVDDSGQSLIIIKINEIFIFGPG